MSIFSAKMPTALTECLSIEMAATEPWAPDAALYMPYITEQVWLGSYYTHWHIVSTSCSGLGHNNMYYKMSVYLGTFSLL